MKAMSPKAGVILLDDSAVLYIGRFGHAPVSIADKAKAPGWATRQIEITGKDRDREVKRIIAAIEEYAMFIDAT